VTHEHNLAERCGQRLEIAAGQQVAEVTRVTDVTDVTDVTRGSAA
jgi:hypothetical protein